MNNLVENQQTRKAIIMAGVAQGLLSNPKLEFVFSEDRIAEINTQWIGDKNIPASDTLAELTAEFTEKLMEKL